MLTHKQLFVFKAIALLFALMELVNLGFGIALGSTNMQNIGINTFYLTMYVSMFWMLFSLRSQEDMVKKAEKGVSAKQSEGESEKKEDLKISQEMVKNIAPNKVNGRWNTHQLFNTMAHFHLSVLNQDNDLLDFCVIETKDNNWFVVNKSSVDIKDPLLFDHSTDSFVMPHFFKNDNEAREYLIQLTAVETGLTEEVLRNVWEDE
jgi:hypothetical protein